MSQDTKGRTMIGTVAPVIPRNTGSVPAQTRPPAGSAEIPAVAPPSSSAIPVASTTTPSGGHPPPPTTQPPTGPTTGQPTVGMRPRSESVAGAAPGTSPGGSSPGSAPNPYDPNEPDVFVGQELGGYTIRRKLAEGGMGVVYEGEHKKIGRLGAIKVLKIEFCRSEDVVERFHQEARAVNAIRHENIVDIYDFGRDPYGRVFFVMEYLEGEPLSSRIRRGALLWSEAYPILEQTLRALKAAHDKGFVHRDLKPDNIWLKYVDGRVQVKLLDFGIAKLVGSESPKEKLTQTGSVIGTPHYMSPEQINGSKDIDQRTDIYAMGVIMYEMFAGVTPFVGDTLQAIMTGHLFKEPPKLADIPKNLGVPGPVAEIVDRMLVKDASARYDNVSDVLGDIYDVNGNRTPTKADTLNRERPRMPTAMLQPAELPRKSGKRSIMIAITGIGVVAIAVAAIAITKMKSASDGVPGPKPESTTKTGPGPNLGPGQPKPPPPPPVLQPPDHDLARKNAQATLRSSLQQVEPAVRTQGADALGKIKDQPSIPALAEHTQTDADNEVRGHTGEALGMIGAADQKALLAKLETAAPAPLKVWYAAGLARLGDPDARKRLVTYAHSKDLAIAYKAGITLAEVSKPGDKPALDAIKALAAQEAKLRAVTGDDYIGAHLVVRSAALHDPNARKALYAFLENDLEGVRLAAAEGLAKLGDDAGKQVLAGMVANQASPKNQLVAAIAQIPLGEYAGQDVILKALADKDADTRGFAAHGLGAIGEIDPKTGKSLRALIELANDKDWTVRIAASRAIIEIVGLDPAVLAQASVDWTKSAIQSEDWAVRKAAAGVLADIPAKDAVPLLATALIDKNTEVRLQGSKVAGKIKTPEAATAVAVAVKAEKDPQVKEQQIKALGEIGAIGGPEAHDTLTQIAQEPGRLGLFAAGSLIAVGDLAGKAKLETAVAAPQTELRLAAVEAASATTNQNFLPTLKIGIGDKLLEIRFAAAEGLSNYMDEKATAVPILQAALDQPKNADVIGRALAALSRLGQSIKDQKLNPAEMIDSPDPKQRLAAIAAVRVMPPAEGVPLLRRVVADQDQEVRHAGVDAIEALITKDRNQAIKMYKPLVNDADAFVRSKASGQLARLVQEPPPPPTPTPGTKIANVDPPTPPTPPTNDAVKTASEAVTTAATKIDTAVTAIDGAAKEQTKLIAGTDHDEPVLAKVDELAKQAHEQADAITADATTADTAVKDAIAAAAASPTPDNAKLIVDTQKAAKHIKTAEAAARDKAAKLTKAAVEHRKLWTGDVELLIAGAKTDISVGNMAAAKKELDVAAKRAAKSVRAELDDAYGEYYYKMSGNAQGAEKRRMLLQARASYQQVLKSGAAGFIQRANDALVSIADDLKELDAPK